MKLPDLKVTSIYVLPLSGSKEALSWFTTIKDIEEKLKIMDKSWWEYLLLQPPSNPSQNSPPTETQDHQPTGRNEEQQHELDVIMSVFAQDTTPIYDTSTVYPVAI